MELTGAAALRRSLASTSPVVPRERRRWMPARVSCVGRGGGGFAELAELTYYEVVPRKAVEAAAWDLSKLRAMGLVAGDVAKEKILSEATELLLQELSQMKDAEDELKKKQKEEKAAMKALKKQQKEAKKAAMKCGDDSSDSSESECEEDQSMKMSCVATTSMSGIEQGMVMSMSVPQIAESNIISVPAMDFDKAAMKAMKKREKEQKKDAKKALKMKKEEEERMASLNPCKDEDSSSCSSESSDRVRGGSSQNEPLCDHYRSSSTTCKHSFPHHSASNPRIRGTKCSDLSRASECRAVHHHHHHHQHRSCRKTTAKSRFAWAANARKSGSLAALLEFEKEMGTGGTVVGCKCLGECGQGPNVRLQSEGSEGKDGVIWTGVDLDDVGIIMASLLAGGRLGI